MGIHPIYDHYNPTDYETWINHKPREYSMYEFLNNLKEDHALYEYLTIKHTPDFVVYDFWLSIKPNELTNDEYLIYEIKSLTTRASELELEIKIPSKWAKPKDQLKAVRDQISFLESKREKIPVTGPVLCMVHFFWSKTSGFGLKSRNDETRFREIWPSFKPAFKSILELYDEYKTPDFKISLSPLAKNNRADHHTKKADRNIIRNLTYAVKHLEVKNDSSASTAKEELSNLKIAYYKRFFEDYE